ncbi:MAG: vanadium-dependent haloperoxidase [Sphingobacteriales bacterium]|nr:vanadium-dependent haloperoxidase [Sphingobacteriales bacterium]MBI3718914.1 vanadium-dependent haloperoxidase [Sphingobacteriales bacterium]
MKYLLAVAGLLLAMQSCKHTEGNYSKLTNDPLLYCKTVKKLNDIVLENNFPPMIACRNYAYANIAAYECIAAGDNNYQSLSGQIKHLPEMPKPEAGKKIDFHLAALFSFTKVGNAVTFPEGSMMGYYADLKHMADSAGMPSDVLENTIAFSDTIVGTIMKWSKKDNYAQTRTASKYTVTDSPGRWIPTPPMYAQAVEPHWREIRTLVLDSASQFMPVRPPKFDVTNKSSEYYKYMLEVKNVGDSLTDEQKHIADFWDDNPFKLNVSGHVMFATKRFSPPGHWMNIVGIGAKAAHADFATAVAAYAKTSIAVFEAFISCWDEKYRTNYVRPETIINKYVSAEWRPYIQTPPFPSYTSGHATNSAAAAEVMTEFFGDNLSFTDTSLLEFGIQNREIKSFRSAAKEAAMSRLYGGIHYRFDNENGAVAGKKLGEFVVQRLHMKKK